MTPIRVAGAGDTLVVTGADDPSSDRATLQSALDDNPEVETFVLRGTFRLDGGQRVSIKRPVEIVGDGAVITGSPNSLGEGLKIQGLDRTLRGVRVAGIAFAYLRRPFNIAPGFDANCGSTRGEVIDLVIEDNTFTDVVRGPGVFGDTRQIRIRDNAIHSSGLSVILQGEVSGCLDTNGNLFFIPHGPVVDSVIQRNATRGAAIAAVFTSDTAIVGNDMRDVGLGGIIVRGTTRARIVENVVVGTTLPPPNAGLLALDPSPETVISDNVVRAPEPGEDGVGGPFGAGIGLFGASQTTVVNNHFDDTFFDYVFDDFEGAHTCDNLVAAGGTEGTVLFDVARFDCAAAGLPENRLVGGFLAPDDASPPAVPSVDILRR